MGKKLMGWKTKGMNQDLSVSAFNPEFSFENMNLRLSTNDGNTLMSWVNEKGTKRIPVKIDTNPWYEIENKTYAESITGGAIGTAVLNNQLVIFTTCPQHIVMNGNQSTTIPKHDYIYVFTWRRFPVVSEQEDDEIVEGLFGRRIYAGNLNFDEGHPLETLVSYEAEHIQKVYWTDGINQPRMINIAASSEKLERWNHPNAEHEGVPSEDVETFFDFVPTISDGNISIVKNPFGGGTFAPGVIQYCFTYFNKYGQQSNIIDVSPLYYLSQTDRGAMPSDEKISCSFKITINNADPNFDYVRIYSIQRTSLNLEPIVKILEDVAINSSSTITYSDNGTTGSMMDPTELLFIGGKEIAVLTMIDKDNTLFMGNIDEKNSSIESIQEWFDDANNKITPVYTDEDKSIRFNTTFGVYAYTHSLKDKSQQDITTFKGGEYYRFGFQLQKKTGEWSEPIYLNDAKNELYPVTSFNNNTVKLITAKANIPITNGENNIIIDTAIYNKIRPLIVFPTIADRDVLCQGVLNPTVFNAQDRIDKSPYAQASWYFRPYYKTGGGAEDPGDEVVKQNLSSNVIQAVNTIPVTTSNQGEVGVSPAGINNLGYLQTLYLMKVTFYDTVGREAVLTRGFLNMQKTTWTKQGTWQTSTSSELIQVPFDGAIDIAPSDNNSMEFILLKKTPWDEPTEVTEYYDATSQQSKGYSTIYEYVISDSIVISPIGYSFPSFGNCMKTTSRSLIYFQANDVLNSASIMGATIKFILGNLLYTVNLIRQEHGDSGAASEDSLPAVSTNTDGNYLNFVHYSSLYTTDDALYVDDTSIDDYRSIIKKVEIQGSVKSFKGIRVITGEDGKNENATNKKSNTQFFVDQSIVTLNSPDIEFDTEVQRWGNEGLALRIVGAIPITSSASAHHIATSSAMLPEGYGTNNPTAIFGTGEVEKNVIHYYGDIYAGRRLVSEYLWNDVYVNYDPNASGEEAENGNNVKTTHPYDFLVYPWHKNGSLNDDPRTQDKASSWLKTKKESNILYSAQTDYLKSHNENCVDYTNISSQIILTENAEVMNYRLPRQVNTQAFMTSEINYYPNIDKILYNDTGTKSIINTLESWTKTFSPHSSVVSMKYKSTSHAIISLNPSSGNSIPILPRNNSVGEYHLETSGGATFWNDPWNNFAQENIASSDASYPFERYSFLWLGELYKTSVDNRFGGNTKEAIKNNRWVIGGPAKNLSDVIEEGEDAGKIALKWNIGDTYYQRYDCLKTYPFTKEDQNQLVEILSFMCETHVNIDGRYDRNRGQLDNTNMSPVNFNLLNDAYSQQDNFFTYKKVLDTDVKNLHYPNHVAYSQTKTSGADVDEWTHVTMASILEMDGDKGEVKALKRLNDAVICFQDTGIAQIMYNENVAISATNGVPIELANSGKVQGKKYLSDTIGCSNKWSIAQSPLGIYFMDSNNKSIYLFNGQLDNLSTRLGFNSWCKKNIFKDVPSWNPKDFGWNSDIDKSNFVSYYDKKNQEVLFINIDTALAFSEKIGAFTSFYNYGDIPYYCNFNDRGIWLTYGPTTPSSVINPQPECELWEHQAGEYCKFFGVNYPYWMTLIGNQEPQMDKTFTNLEFRATIDGEGVEEQTKFVPTLPFDYLEAWDEYQHGIAQLQNKNGHGAMQHHLSDTTATLKRKFRIWRCDIPRDNCDVDNTIENPMGIYRFRKRPLDRMRNPWIYLKLMKDAAEQGAALNRTEIHDLIMTYFT